ncbi:MAG: methyl-coenzyme M reductase operon protein D [Methanomassiliicoccales archaeon]|jgi:methyl-coenzyme M reductase subunit D
MKGASSPEAVPLPEIMIMPNRLLSADTTEKVLNRIYEVNHVRQVTCQGENLPKKLTQGPGTGLEVNHPERKKINVKGRETELFVQVGRIFVEVDDIDNVQYVTKKVEKICEELLLFGFTLEIGRYSKFKPTVTDYAKGRC